MALPLLNFTNLVETMAAAVQSAARPLIDLSVGSVQRALLESSASAALWLQWLVLQVLQTTRAGTSQGADLDSWVADFGLMRLPAASATGRVTVSRITPTQSAFVPVGVIVKTADGTQSFTIGPDTSNASYSAALGGYTIGSGVASLTVPAVATVAGSSGNVQAGAITLLAAAVPGVDAVTNASPFAGGLNAETDVALRARFVNFLNSRSRATNDAIAYAVTSQQQGMQYAIAENVNTAGQAQPSSFVVTVDDGSGAPPPALLTSVSNAIEAVRPIGSTFAVQPPTIVTASITAALTLAAGSDITAAITSVSASLGSYIETLPIGAGLPLSRIAQIAHDASTGVIGVTGTTINGVAADLIVGPSALVKPGTILVT